MLDYKFHDNEKIDLTLAITCDQAARGDLDKVRSCFIWDNSPQGFDYWCQIYEERKSMTQEDIKFLRDRASFIRGLVTSGINHW